MSGKYYHMAESYSSQLLDAMDRLWFHQIILSPEPTSVLSSSNALQSCTSSSSESCQWEGDVVSSSSFSQKDCNNEVEDKRQDDGDDNRLGRERLSRKNLISNKIRSQSSSPWIERPRKSSSLLTNAGLKLQKFLSCSRLHDLELEELKGFMDLGFQFEMDQLNPRTVRVIPALQRVDEKYGTSTLGDIEPQTKEKKNKVVEPY
ncbi:uncharacterized protein LOC110717274 [Chenopodium quinoa]|uniref:uncharacterized protein LOC110717274 n=1 Tax=Chenopodium quinoa TaxID=63459 RepID=UPI000B76CAD3|nr:uncharacterized protein LOC110717274 [Chenopodium quinoa]